MAKAQHSTEEMLKLRESGLSNKEIATTLGCSWITVYRRIGKQSEEMTSEHMVEVAKKAREAKNQKNVIETPSENVVEEVETPSENVIEAAPNEKPIEPIETNLFKFALCPSWWDKLYILADMTQPEPWGFKDPEQDRLYPEVRVLVYYINRVFYRAAYRYNQATSRAEADKYVYLRKNIACIHTGLYTPTYQGIYFYFQPSRRPESGAQWCLVAFKPASTVEFNAANTLPPPYRPTESYPAFQTSWPIRVNADHILLDEKNKARLPESIREAWNLPLLLETAVEMARRKALIEPGIVVASSYQGRPRYTLPIYLTNMDTPDLAMTLDTQDGYYVCRTCVTLQMAYLDARMEGRPTAKWLVDLVGGDW